MDPAIGRGMIAFGSGGRGLTWDVRGRPPEIPQDPPTRDDLRYKVRCGNNVSLTTEMAELLEALVLSVWRVCFAFIF